MSELPRRPCLALPFTVLPTPEGVHLVAGEDWRYFLAGATLATWLPGWLPHLDGHTPMAALLAQLPEAQRTEAEAILRLLHGERLLREGPIEAAHRPTPAGVTQVLGAGSLAEDLTALAHDQEAGDGIGLVVQDSLDFCTALNHNRRLRAEGRRWFWVCSGPMTRGYVSPLFLPDAGPCLACLLAHFRRLSPAPFLYPLLEAAAEVRPSPLPAPVARILADLVRAKVALAQEPRPLPALYRLHVVEADSLEVTSHAVPRNPECAVCGAAR